MDLAGSIGKATAQLNGVVQAVNPECFNDATPCSEYDVRTLAAHIAGFAQMSLAAARREEFSPAEFDAEGWQARYATVAGDLAEAWAAPGALEGSAPFGGNDVPAERAAAITLQELVIHGWDLAVATGQSFEPDVDVAAAVRYIVERGAERARDGGAYGPPIEVDEDASDWETALGTSGRDPAWSAS